MGKQKGAKAGNPIVKLRTYKGKIVVGWSNMKETGLKSSMGSGKKPPDHGVSQ
jgi:hypothetical protein